MHTHNMLPHGAGNIIVDHRNTARPFVARRYDRNDADGNPRYLYLGSYPTRLDAEIALHEASFKTNAELRSKSYTFLDIYNLLITDYKSLVSPSEKKNYPLYLRRCSDLHNLYYCDITLLQMQRIIDNLPYPSTHIGMRTFLRKMDKVAFIVDCITKKRSEFLTIKKSRVKSPRLPFSDREIYHLLEHRDNPDVQLALVLVYTGMRGCELRNLKKSDVNLQEKYLIIRDSKTNAGRNRIIPIHPIILPFLASRIEESPVEHLFTGVCGRSLNVDNYQISVYRAIDLVKERKHVPHEFRHTFRTRLDDMHGNEICIDLLMGHQMPNLIDRIYTHKSLDQLRETILLLWPERESE